jgi:hypothetical protein
MKVISRQYRIAGWPPCRSDVPGNENPGGLFPTLKATDFPRLISIRQKIRFTALAGFIANLCAAGRNSAMGCAAGRTEPNKKIAYKNNVTTEDCVRFKKFLLNYQGGAPSIQHNTATRDTWLAEWFFRQDRAKQQGGQRPKGIATKYKAVRGRDRSRAINKKAKWRAA